MYNHFVHFWWAMKSVKENRRVFGERFSFDLVVYISVIHKYTDRIFIKLFASSLLSFSLTVVIFISTNLSEQQ